MPLKIIVVGAGNVGKTSFCKSLFEGDHEKTYVPTLGTQVFPLKFGDVEVNCWDVAGQKKNACLGSGYYIGANAAILMFDLGDPKSLKALRDIRREVEFVCGDIPVVVCGNKCDLKDRSAKPNLKKLQRLGVYYETSVQSRLNVEEVFSHILHKLGVQEVESKV